MNSSDECIDKEKIGINVFWDKIKKDKKAVTIIIFGILGMLIILCSGTESTEKSEEKVTEILTDFSKQEVLRNLKELIESIDGVGAVKLYITYKGEEETVYAVNSEERYSDNNTEISKDYILTDDEDGLEIKTLYPQVLGVAVVCQGGDDPIIKEKIYSVVSALFDIRTNNISVVGMSR